MSFNTLSIEELRSHVVETYRVGGGTRPEVLLIRVGDRQAILKDYGRSDPGYRYVIGPLLAYRETQALRALAGVRGVPELFRKVNSRAVLMQYIEGCRAKDMPPEALSDELFDRLYGLVREIHRCGIAHCDLRSRGNTIFGKDGQPYLVDFVAHFVRGRRWNLFWRWAFGRFCQADVVAIARLKQRLAPHLLTSEEKRDVELDRKMAVARVARFIGNSIRHISRFALTNRKTRA